MADQLRAYTWKCPICNETKRSLSLGNTIRGQAENALRRHVKNRNGDEHGAKGEFPPGFDPQNALEYITFAEDVDASMDEDYRSA